MYVLADLEWVENKDKRICVIALGTNTGKMLE